MNYTINKIESFDPYNFIEEAKDKDGNVIVQDNGEPLKYLSTDAKKLWFTLVKPNGRIVSERMQEDNPRTARYRVSIYMDSRDEEPKVSWEHQETAIGDEDYDSVSSKAQTVALGKALSIAGFGAEIEAYLHMKVEGEEKRKEEAFTLAEKLPEKVEAETNDLLSLLDEKTKEPEISYEDALNSKIECTDFAKTTIKGLEGKTFKEVMSIPGKELIYEKILKQSVQVTQNTLDAAKRLQLGA